MYIFLFHIHIINSIALISSKKGFNVQSYGTGNMVKLPGSAPDKPNVYDFGVTYDFMYRDLMQKDYELYPLKKTRVELYLCMFFIVFV